HSRDDEVGYAIVVHIADRGVAGHFEISAALVRWPREGLNGRLQGAVVIVNTNNGIHSRAARADAKDGRHVAFLELLHRCADPRFGSGPRCFLGEPIPEARELHAVNSSVKTVRRRRPYLRVGLPDLLSANPDF